MRAWLRKHPFESFLLIFSVFLVLAGTIRIVETNSGNTFIHNIDVESYEGFHYSGRVYRPIRAQALDPAPAVLLLGDRTDDRYSLAGLASALGKNGFVVLAIEDFSRGSTAAQNGFLTENALDAGYTYLNTRTFVDHSRIGLAAFGQGSALLNNAETLNGFSASVLMDPVEISVDLQNEPLIIRSLAQTVRKEDNERRFFIPHALLSSAPSVIRSCIQHFRDRLNPEGPCSAIASAILFLLRPLAFITLLCSLIPLDRKFRKSCRLSSAILSGLLLLIFTGIVLTVLNSTFISVWLGITAEAFTKQGTRYIVFFLALFTLLAALEILCCKQVRNHRPLLAVTTVFLIGSAGTFTAFADPAVWISLILITGYALMVKKTWIERVPEIIIAAGIAASQFASYLLTFIH